MIQPKTLTKTAAYQVSIQHIETYAPLIKELGLIQKIEDPELQLSLSSQTIDPSFVRVTAINGKRAFLVTTTLELNRSSSPRWEVLDIQIEPASN